ncbi:MAG: hypothetical protein AAGD01_13440 [Acidobacteriota bacterium]
MKRTIIGSLLAALVVFTWGFVFWNVLPPAWSVRAPVEQADQLSAELQKHLPSSGTYALPHPATFGGDTAAAGEAYLQGPIATIQYHAEGAPVVSGGKLGSGFVHIFITAFLIATLLGWVASSVPSYGARVKVVVLAGFAAAFFAHLDDPIWYLHSWGFEFYHFAYDFTSWVIYGLILGKFTGDN